MPNITISAPEEARHYRKSRNVELSTLKFIKDNLSDDWSSINLVKSWTQLEKKSNPVICAILDDTNYTRSELGNTTFRESYVFTIDIFATSDAMRIDLSDWLLDILNPGWTYYEISQTVGHKKTLIYTEAGRCRMDAVYENSKVDLGQRGDVKDKYRQTIIIAVTVGC